MNLMKNIFTITKKKKKKKKKISIKLMKKCLKHNDKNFRIFTRINFLKYVCHDNNLENK